MPSLSLATLKRGLLLFWAAWLSIVVLTNTFDALRALDVLDTGWRFASGNWAFLVETTRVYDTPNWLQAILYAGVIAWEGLGALLLWRAFSASLGNGLVDRRPTDTAFVVNLALWAAFVLVDEVFLAYDVEATHLRLFIAQLVTLVAIHLLPDGTAA